MKLKMNRGYDFYEVSSAMQKAIRRADPEAAAYWAVELYESGYKDYVWRRLLIISAEDVYGVITGEIVALHQAWTECQKVVKSDDNVKGRIFVCKALVLLALAKKNRDPDHLLNLVTADVRLSESNLQAMLSDARKEEYRPIPEYAIDAHTQAGRRKGKTKADFFRDEFNALKPREPGLFDPAI